MNEIELTYSQYYNLVQAVTDREQWNATDLRIAVSVSCFVIAILISAAVATYLTAGFLLCIFIPAVVFSFFAPICIGSLIHAKNFEENKIKALRRLDEETKEKIVKLPPSFSFLLSDKLSVTIIETEDGVGNLLRPY